MRFIMSFQEKNLLLKKICYSSLDLIKKSISLRLVMNADMIPGMLYEEHGFEFKMRCLKGIILESGKLIHPVEGRQVGYNQAAKECTSLNLELVEPESRFENEQINSYLVQNGFFLGEFSKRWWEPEMPAITVSLGTKYACILSKDGDRICLQ